MASPIAAFKAVETLETLVNFEVACKHLSDDDYKMEFVRRFYRKQHLQVCFALEKKYFHIDANLFLREEHDLVVIIGINDTPICIELLRVGYAKILELVEAKRKVEEPFPVHDQGDIYLACVSIIATNGLRLDVVYEIGSNLFSCDFCQVDFNQLQESIDIPHVRKQLAVLAHYLVDEQQSAQKTHSDAELLDLLSLPNVDVPEQGKTFTDPMPTQKIAAKSHKRSHDDSLSFSCSVSFSSEEIVDDGDESADDDDKPRKRPRQGSKSD